MFETFESLPESTTTVKSGKYGPHNQTKREAQTRWVLNPEAEGVPQVVVDLTTSHDPDSKVFRTSLTWGTVETVKRHPNDGPGGYTVYSWASDHAYVTVARTPVARYAKSALEAEHARALDEVVSSCADSDGRAWHVFSEAANENGLTEEVYA